MRSLLSVLVPFGYMDEARNIQEKFAQILVEFKEAIPTVFVPLQLPLGKVRVCLRMWISYKYSRNILHYSTPPKKRLMLPRNQSPLKSPRCKISTGSCKSYHRRALICCKYIIYTCRFILFGSCFCG